MRTILHSDMNNFYASVECLDNPDLRGKPVAVCGDPELRHGIVLAKSQAAKRYGVKTGQVIWEAKQLCRDLVVVPPRYHRYIEISSAAREIYISYTDQVEPFGLDECWLDVTGSSALYGSGQTIADEIRMRVKRDLGLTVSVGVSYNKVFAKLGSDLRKPDATTVIGPEDYREKTWGLPVSDLLYVGPATTRKLRRIGIQTIGDLARCQSDVLYRLLGKIGVMLWLFANGRDSSSVSAYTYTPPIKTIGNSTTAYRDLTSASDVKITLMALCESVAARLREQNSKCTTVQLGIRDNKLSSWERQITLRYPTCNAMDIWEAAYSLYKGHNNGLPPRSLSVRASGLSIASEDQLSMFADEAKTIQRNELDRALDKIRGKYGYYAVQRAVTLLDPKLNIDAKADNVIHPIGFLSTLKKE